MSSVRQRVERELREAPEQFVETGTRRVALGASGPTPSTRQRQQLQDAENEVVTPSGRTSGSSGYLEGGFSRVRDRQVAEAASQPQALKSPEQIAGDYYFALNQQNLAATKAREQREEAENAARIRKRAEADAADKARRELAVKEKELAGFYFVSGATNSERSIVDNLMKRAGTYGDVNAHAAKLQQYRWAMTAGI